MRRMNKRQSTQFAGPQASSLREILASQGIKPADASRRHLELIVAARKATESAICVAMVTSAIPGIEVKDLDESSDR